MKFVFEDFQLIPYTRMTTRGLWIPKAQKYIQNQTALAWGYKAQMLQNDWPMLPPRVPLFVRWLVVRTGPLYQCDIDNLLKALCDAAKGVVFVDDRYITRDLGGEKRQGRAGVEVEFGLVADL
jgi:Holliday junction resolvase RusA-like endonuclease